MINLLSHKEQRTIYREYMLRIATCVFIALGIIGSVAIATLVPSYMRINAEIAVVEAEQKTKQAQVTPEDQAQDAEAKTFLSEVQALRVLGATSSAIFHIERVIALKPARVSLIGFQYEYEGNGKVKLGVRGKADRREDLLEFKELLETKAGFSGIDLPAQTLIKRTDIQFTMDLRASSVVAPRASAEVGASLP